MNSMTDRIRARLQAIPPAQPFRLPQFLDLGRWRDVVRVLRKEVAAGRLKQLRPGIYYRPKTLGCGLHAVPSQDAVAQLFARQGAVVGITSATAIQRFGFSTQMVVRPVFATTGRDRRISYGNTVIELQHVNDHVFALGHATLGQAWTALCYLNPTHMTAGTFKVFQRKLTPEDFERLCQTKHLMPPEMARALEDCIANPHKSTPSSTP